MLREVLETHRPAGSGRRWPRRPSTGRPTVAGAPIHLRCWGTEDRPGLVFVHGGAAHSGWWDHVAPFFAGSHRVVALDLSGHGDSGRRDGYDDGQLGGRGRRGRRGRAGIAAPPLVVGHSMGGWVAVTAGVRHGATGRVRRDRLAAGRPAAGGGAAAASGGARHRGLPDAEEAIGPVPHAAAAGRRPAVRARAHRAQLVRPVEGGWSWKFDPKLFAERPPLRDLLPALRCRAALIRSEFGLVPAGDGRRRSTRCSATGADRRAPDAGHHPMLDQPLPLVTALRMLLQQWAVS